MKHAAAVKRVGLAGGVRGEGGRVQSGRAIALSF